MYAFSLVYTLHHFWQVPTTSLHLFLIASIMLFFLSRALSDTDVACRVYLCRSDCVGLDLVDARCYRE